MNIDDVLRDDINRYNEVVINSKTPTSIIVRQEFFKKARNTQTLTGVDGSECIIMASKYKDNYDEYTKYITEQTQKFKLPMENADIDVIRKATQKISNATDIIETAYTHLNAKRFIVDVPYKTLIDYTSKTLEKLVRKNSKRKGSYIHTKVHIAHNSDKNDYDDYNITPLNAYYDRERQNHEWKGGHHASPVEHERSATTRRIFNEDGTVKKVVPVKGSIVNKGNTGGGTRLIHIKSPDN